MKPCLCDGTCDSCSSLGELPPDYQQPDVSWVFWRWVAMAGATVLTVGVVVAAVWAEKARSK